MISSSSSGVSQLACWVRLEASAHSRSPSSTSWARACWNLATWRCSSMSSRARPARSSPGVASRSSHARPTWRTRHGRCRPIPPPASSTKECSASLRRCHEQFAGVSSSRSASSVAVSGPSTGEQLHDPEPHRVGERRELAGIAQPSVRRSLLSARPSPAASSGASPAAWHCPLRRVVTARPLLGRHASKVIFRKTSCNTSRRLCPRVRLRSSTTSRPS